MEKEFVPYELALELKQLGFDIPSVSGYSYSDSDNLLTQAILYQQAFRWFRDKYGLCSWIERMYTVDSICYYRYTCEYKKDPLSKTHEVILSLKEYDNYEEAELACLQKLIEIVKTK